MDEGFSESGRDEREGRQSRLTPDWWWGSTDRSLRERLPTPERDRFPGPHSWDVEKPLAADRLLAGFFVVVFAVAALTILGYFVTHPFRPQLLAFVYAGLWVFVAVYTVPAVVWMYAAFFGWRHDQPDLEYGTDAVQVRILTVDAEDVVQHTVDVLPDAFTDRHVIAEEALDVDGATVHVVPNDFDCEATDKGRALEWARRHLDCEKEFVLFLDEDTLVTEFDGLPDTDIVQFREWPMYTGSSLAYWAEVLRMGYQTEQTGFEKLNVPLYAWGGGIAARKDVEDAVTWDFDTLIEDTVFAWKAVEQGASFDVLDTKFRNQAPLSVSAMCRQRRRWLVGTLREEDHLPRWFHALDAIRNVSWAFSPVTPLVLVVSGLLPLQIPAQSVFHLAMQALFVFSLVWVWRGWRYYEGPTLRTLPLFVIYPVVTAFHAAGAAWGFVDPPDSFETTAKTDDADD